METSIDMNKRAGEKSRAVYLKHDRLPTVVFVNDSDSPVAAFYLAMGSRSWTAGHIMSAWTKGHKISYETFQSMCPGEEDFPLPDPDSYDHTKVYPDYDDHWESMV